MAIIPDERVGRTGDVIIYDLRDSDAWEQARSDRAAWGKEQSVVHDFGLDDDVVEFRSGSASDLKDSA